MPVYNQIEEFPALLEELKRTPLPCTEFVIVDSGSFDGCEKLIETSGFTFIKIPKNQGVGYAFIQVIKWALERNFDVIGGLAGNGKMLPSEMIRVLNPILEGRADFVQGSRNLPGGNSPHITVFRKFAIPIVSLLVSVLFMKKVTDATCGYRAFNLDIIRKANFKWDDQWLYTYGFELYIHVKVVQETALRYLEVPITMRYPQSKKRYSKIRYKDWFTMFYVWIRAAFDGKGFNI